jgi:hypothetical protein
MSIQTLETKIHAAGGAPLSMMRQSQVGAYVYREAIGQTVVAD